MEETWPVSLGQSPWLNASWPLGEWQSVGQLPPLKMIGAVLGAIVRAIAGLTRWEDRAVQLCQLQPANWSSYACPAIAALHLESPSIRAIDVSGVAGTSKYKKRQVPAG